MLKDKVAIVTGSSSGIGKATAIALAKEGAKVIVNYASSDDLADQVVDTITQNGGVAEKLKWDISSFEDTKDNIKYIHDKYGTIDILVNNAGITKDMLLLKMKEEEFDKVIQVNLKGAFNCIKHCSRIMMKQRSGKIINISSVVGQTGNVGQCNYAASKAGLIGLTKSAAKELAKRGINVNAIAPGFIETKMTDVLNDKIKDMMLNSIPLNKFGKPEDIANAVCFLASEKSNYITGQVINVNGGMYM